MGLKSLCMASFREVLCVKVYMVRIFELSHSTRLKQHNNCMFSKDSIKPAPAIKKIDALKFRERF